MYRLVAEVAGEPTHTQPDACCVTEVSNPGVIHRVNNGAHVAELPQAPFLGCRNTATANPSKALRYTALSWKIALYGHAKMWPALGWVPLFE